MSASAADGDGDLSVTINGHPEVSAVILNTPARNEDDWHEVIPPIVPDVDVDQGLENDTNTSHTNVITGDPDTGDSDRACHRRDSDRTDDALSNGNVDQDEDDIADFPDSPDSPIFIDDPDNDPDYTEDEDEVAVMKVEFQPLVFPKVEMPDDADWDPILELEPVEEMVGEDGNEIRAWSCKVCSIRFQFHASYAKHIEREHPDGMPLNWWELDEPRIGLDRCYRVLDDDSDDDWFDDYPKKRKRGRPKKRSNPVRRTNTQQSEKRSHKKKKPVVVKEDPVFCSECNSEFNTKKKLDIHMKRYHFLPFSCKVCEKRFESFKMLYVHSELIHNVIVVQDDKDKTATLSDAGESEDEDHRVPVEGITESLFPCDCCKRHYVTEIALSGHLLRRHYDEIPDMAVIETHKRQWKTRFDPENIAKHESAIEKLGKRGIESIELAKQKKLEREKLEKENEDRRKKKKRQVPILDEEEVDRLHRQFHMITELKNPEDLNSKRPGPVVLKRSGKTLEELAEALLQRNLRKKRREYAAKRGVDPETVTIKQRGARKTVAEKLATHMAKLARRRARDHAKRNAKDPNEDPMNAETENEDDGDQMVLDPETGEHYRKGQRRRRKRKRDGVTYDEEMNPQSFKYSGVKDFCRLCNKEFENDRLTVWHLKEAHSNYTAEDKKREDEILKNILTQEELEQIPQITGKADPIPGQPGSTYIKKFVCQDCRPKKAFMHAYKLAAHMEDAHDGQKLIIDGKEVSRACPNELKRTEDQRIICHRCGKEIRKRSLRMHMLRMHAGEPFRKSFPCDQCDKSYPVAHHLFWHRRRAHMKTVLYTCEVCGKEIHSPRTYKIHMRVHTGFMFSCKHCGEKFKSQQGVANHEKRHTSTMDFECQFCGKRFWWQRDVNKHERLIHEDGVVHPDQIAKNKAKDWEAESLVNAKKMRYLTDNPRAPNGSGANYQGRGRPRKKATAAAIAAPVSEDSVSQEYVPPSGHMTRAATSAAQAAKMQL